MSSFPVMKQFSVTVLLDSYDSDTVRTEVSESLNNNFSLTNVEVVDVQELDDE